MLTMEERVEKFIKRKVDEHNAVSVGLIYAGDRADYYKGRLTELKELLIDFMCRLDANIDFVAATDESGNEYEKAIIAE